MSLYSKDPDSLALLRARMTRRVLLAWSARTAVLVGGLAALAGTEGAYGEATLRSRRPKVLLTDSERVSFARIQEHFLPSAPGSPGARDVSATAYLEAALNGSDIDPTDLPALRNGLARIMDFSMANYRRPVSALASAELERALRHMEEHGGEEWLTLLMGYTIEAYVGDPAYGGNPNGIVWEWLGHVPGFPRPSTITPETRR